jgi:hypothetical protein
VGCRCPLLLKVTVTSAAIFTDQGANPRSQSKFEAQHVSDSTLFSPNRRPAVVFGTAHAAAPACAVDDVECPPGDALRAMVRMLDIAVGAVAGIALLCDTLSNSLAGGHTHSRALVVGPRQRSDYPQQRARY